MEHVVAYDPQWCPWQGGQKLLNKFHQGDKFESERKIVKNVILKIIEKISFVFFLKSLFKFQNYGGKEGI